MIARLWATTRLDLWRQVVDGFWPITILVGAATAVVLRSLPVHWERWWVVIVFSQAIITAYYFAAVTLMKQRTEGTLAAQAVSPLRPGERVAALVLTLTMLSIIEVGVVAALGVGGPPHWGQLLAGAAGAAAVLVAFGCVTVVGHVSFTDFLLPSGAYTAVVAIPMFPDLGLGDGWWLWLHPLQPAATLIRGAFVDAAEPVLPALLLGCAWVAIGGWVAARRLGRLRVGSEG